MVSIRDNDSHGCCFTLLISLVLLITGKVVLGETLENDRQVLQNLKMFLENQNHVNRGRYAGWNLQDSSPCNWLGISCNGGRVTGIDLSDNDIYGEIFGNFSTMSELTYLDLSKNSIGGKIPADLGQCLKLKHLNLSHNIIDSEVNLTGLNSIEVLDLSMNKIRGDIRFVFPAICNGLAVVNVSSNNFTGEIDTAVDGCWNLQYVDLSANNLSGDLKSAIFGRVKEFVVSENKLDGQIPSWIFPENCSLQLLDLSENTFWGEFPPEISNCQNLAALNLWGNKFSGKIPEKIGSVQSLQALLLGNNSFISEIPETLLGLRNLVFLDLSGNNFKGNVQEIFGRFTQVKYLLLHDNLYTGGLVSSGILNLPNLSRLDLSYNNLSGPLPVEISQMFSLKYLFFAYNQFTGNIPLEYGNLPGLQALDLSFNRLDGSIPSSFGKLTSLLWLMLANNSLTGEIPPALGDCSSLLWLNLENNKLSGPIPEQLTNIGKNVTPIFVLNRENDRIAAGAGECLAMRRWIPADYPPFSFVYTVLTRKNCIALWDKLLKGYGLFPVCVPGSSIRPFTISGYLQLSGNKLSGEVPREIGKMLNFSMLHLGINQLSGSLPKEIGLMPIVVLNISQNKFSGQIPGEIGNIKCLQNLDLSYNNFSGAFPTSLNNLTDLSKFNISYNPYISGVIPSTGQLATFENWSYLGNPLLRLPSFIDNNTKKSPTKVEGQRRPKKLNAYLGFLALILALLICGIMTIIVCVMVKSPSDNTPGYLLEDTKSRYEFGSSSTASSPWLSDTVKVIRLDKLSFTHADILTATSNFSDGKIIGRGGSGTVYQGSLPDGREIAVKKIQREGTDGEREFRAEMEVLSGNGFNWPHPNLVTLYGWCLDGSEKLLVYEYMSGGSLEDLVADRTKLSWLKRINISVDVARALLFLHHECYPAIVHRDIKASNVLLDKDGKARVTDFGLARVVDAGGSHVSTMVAGTIGYVAPEYGQTWQATTKGDVYSYGVFVMELATGRRAVDGGEESLVEWAKRVMGDGRNGNIPVALMVTGLSGGAEELSELVRIGLRCCAEAPQARPNMKEVLGMLVKIPTGSKRNFSYNSPRPPSL